VKNWLLQNRQFLLYCVIGGCGTGLTLLTYAVLVEHFRLNYQTANATGYAAGTVLSFVLNARFNFRTKDRPWQRFTVFLVVALLGWAMAAGLLWLLVGQLLWNALFAYLVVIIAVVLLQYNLNRLLSFRKT
jgi:putative flippase GtrA